MNTDLLDSARRPMVTVIIPAFNAAEFLRETIDSVIQQTHRELEVLVIDDGSEDDTGQIARAYGDPVHTITIANQGVAVARNTGIERARGDLIAFLDSDDLWEPNKLEKQVVLIDEKCRFVYCDTHSFGIRALEGAQISDGKTLPSGNILRPLVESNFVATSTVLMCRRLAQECGGFNPDLKICQDWELWLNVASKTKVGCVPVPLVKYRMRRGSLGGDLERRLEECEIVIHKGLGMLDVSAQERRRIERRSMAGCYDYSALLAEIEGNRAEAMRYRIESLKRSFSFHNLRELSKLMLGPRWARRLRKLRSQMRG